MIPHGHKPFRWATAYAGRFFTVLAGGIVLVWLLWFPAALFLGLTAGPNGGLFGDPFGILNTVFSGIAFAAIAFALALQHHELIEQIRRDRRERIESAQEFARLFYDQTLINVREQAQATRIGWLTEAFDRRSFAAHWVDSDEPGQGKSRAGGLPDTWPTSRLIDYYAVLYHQIDAVPDEERAALGRRLTARYLWPYWRGYLLELGSEIRKQYEERVAPEAAQAAQYPLVSWVGDLEALDRLSGLPPYHRTAHPIDRRYPGAES